MYNNIMELLYKSKCEDQSGHKYFWEEIEDIATTQQSVNEEHLLQERLFGEHS